MLTFDAGQTLVILDNPDHTGFLKEIVEDKSVSNGKTLGLILGDLVYLSPYDQYRTLVNITPSSVRPFGPRPEAVRGMTLLTIKVIALPGPLQTGAFTFEMPGKRGFQFGDPQKSKRVAFKIFGAEGYIVEIFCTAGRDRMLTQPELNTILKSLHPVADASGQSRSPN